MKQYIYGVHVWTDIDGIEYKVMQMVDNMGGLSNTPGEGPLSLSIIHVRTKNARDAIQYGKELALEHKCNFLEVNCAHGNGSYKLIGIGR